ncbi:hypothetical protein ACH5RR_000722 [Cinchona calisaya]|uniref:F-box domain-containing protein n=1 Tax=Cinchona calisaya TaxID=153742 RepID=A0ABD3B1Q7_9GENT
MEMIKGLESSDRNLRSCKARKCVRFGDGNNEVLSFMEGDWPEWLLIEVLCRVPVKCVFRFKCVSKQWLYVISHSSFARFYIARASLFETRPWAILSSSLNAKGSDMRDYPGQKLLGDMYSDDFKCPDTYVLPMPRSQEAYGQNYKILAVNDGLVLYGWRHDSRDSMNHIAEYYICNPTTKKWFALPPPQRYFKWVSAGFITRVEGGTLTSYKVVRLDCLFRKSNVLNFEIFSSETGQWVDSTVLSDHEIEVAFRRMPVSFNGNLHWVDRELGIVVFDPYKNPHKCRIIRLPPDINKQLNNSKYNGIHSLCDVSQGHLKYFEVSGNFEQQAFLGFSIWVLDDYITGHWHLQHRVRHSDILFPDTLPRSGLPLIPVSFHPFDPNIFFLGWRDIIVSYNLQTRRLEALGVPYDFQAMLQRTGRFDFSRMRFWWWAFMLVLPPWPTSVSSPLSVA